MKIDTTKPRLPIDRTDRLKFPLKPLEKEADESSDLFLARKVKDWIEWVEDFTLESSRNRFEFN